MKSRGMQRHVSLAPLETIFGKFVSSSRYPSSSAWRVWINSPRAIQPSNPAKTLGTKMKNFLVSRQKRLTPSLLKLRPLKQHAEFQIYSGQSVWGRL